MTSLDGVRRRLSSPPTFYGRMWLTSVNATGLVVVLGVLFDVTLLLGTGQTGIFRRALYPFAPIALTLGVGLGEGNGRHAALSAGALVGYVLLLAVVGTLGAALATAPTYVGGGVALVALSVAVGAGLGRVADADPGDRRGV